MSKSKEMDKLTDWFSDIIQKLGHRFPKNIEDIIEIIIEISDKHTAEILFVNQGKPFYRQYIPYTICSKGKWRFFYKNEMLFWEQE